MTAGGTVTPRGKATQAAQHGSGGGACGCPQRTEPASQTPTELLSPCPQAVWVGPLSPPPHRTQTDPREPSVRAVPQQQRGRARQMPCDRKAGLWAPTTPEGGGEDAEEGRAKGSEESLPGSEPTLPRNRGPGPPAPQGRLGPRPRAGRSLVNRPVGLARLPGHLGCRCLVKRRATRGRDGVCHLRVTRSWNKAKDPAGCGAGGGGPPGGKRKAVGGPRGQGRRLLAPWAAAAAPALQGAHCRALPCWCQARQLPRFCSVNPLWARAHTSSGSNAGPRGSRPALPVTACWVPGQVPLPLGERVFPSGGPSPGTDAPESLAPRPDPKDQTLGLARRLRPQQGRGRGAQGPRHRASGTDRSRPPPEAAGACPPQPGLLTVMGTLVHGGRRPGPCPWVPQACGRPASHTIV